MDNENMQIPHRHRLREERPKAPYFKLRNVLNIIFMVLGLVGVLIYIFGDDTTGIIVVLVAMVFKMVESALRFFR